MRPEPFSSPKYPLYMPNISAISPLKEATDKNDALPLSSRHIKALQKLGDELVDCCLELIVWGSGLGV